MSRSMWRGCAILVLAMSVIGCAKVEDKLVKEQVATLEKLSAAYANVVDDKSWDAAKAEIGVLGKQMGELDKKLTELGAERKEAALKKHAAELKDAADRFNTAKRKAAQTAWGVQPAKK